MSFLQNMVEMTFFKKCHFNMSFQQLFCTSACTLCLLFVSVLVIERGVLRSVQIGSEEQGVVESVDNRYHAASSTGVQSPKFYAIA